MQGETGDACYCLSFHNVLLKNSMQDTVYTVHYVTSRLFCSFFLVKRTTIVLRHRV